MVIGPTITDHHRTWGSKDIIKADLSQARRPQHGEVVTMVCGLCAGEGWIVQDGTSHVTVIIVKSREVCGRGDMRMRVSCSTTGNEYLFDRRKQFNIEESRRSCSCSGIPGWGSRLGIVGVEWCNQFDEDGDRGL
jgi:hypothetical protein